MVTKWQTSFSSIVMAPNVNDREKICKAFMQADKHTDKLKLYRNYSSKSKIVGLFSCKINLNSQN